MRLLRSAATLLAAVLVLVAAGGQRPEAARDPLSPASAARMELLVLEVRGCTFCNLVRSRIQPAHEQTPRARELPMRYVDVTSIDETKLGLARPIDTVPTIVLMRDGREVERIAGYVGPETFLRLLSSLLQQLED